MRILKNEPARKNFKKISRVSYKGEFTLSTTDTLSRVSNIPTVNDYSGIYLFYDDFDRLIYVGISGKEDAEGNFFHRKNGLRGRFITGKQFHGARRKTLPLEMLKEGIKFLKIKWYVTYCDDCRDIPRTMERDLITAFKVENKGVSPKWNKKD